MSAEESVKKELETKFPFLAEKIRVQRVRRLWLDVDYDKFRTVFEYCIKQLNFSFLCALTGLDDGDKLGLIYHLANAEGAVLNLKTAVPMAEPVVHSVTDLFPAAEVYERELIDLLGAKVPELLPGFRYPLTDDWPSDQYPLRKSWKVPAEQPCNERQPAGRFQNTDRAAASGPERTGKL